MSDDKWLRIEMFPTWFWRWHAVAVWQDGVIMRTTKSTWGYHRSYLRMHTVAQEARRG